MFHLSFSLEEHAVRTSILAPRTQHESSFIHELPHPPAAKMDTRPSDIFVAAGGIERNKIIYLLLFDRMGYITISWTQAAKVCCSNAASNHLSSTPPPVPFSGPAAGQVMHSSASIFVRFFVSTTNVKSGPGEYPDFSRETDTLSRQFPRHLAVMNPESTPRWLFYPDSPLNRTRKNFSWIFSVIQFLVSLYIKQ